jgi:hypothetical protein
MTVSWFRPQNQAGYGLSVAPQNQQEYEDDAGYASRSSGLLHLKASQVRIFQSGIKTGGGVAWIMHMSLLRRLRRVEAKDGWVDAMGCVGAFHPNFAVFYVLCHIGILIFVFCLDL